MVNFEPEWMTFEIRQALEEIQPPNVRKKRTTVLRLADARANNRSQAETFKLPDVCCKSTWLGQCREGHKLPGWRDDPAIQHALELATARAQEWEDTHIARQIAKTRRQLADHAPGAELSLYGLALGATSEGTKRLACLDILNRVGAELASRATVPDAPGGGEMLVKFDLSNVPPDALAEVAGEGEQGAGDQAAGEAASKEETE